MTICFSPLLRFAAVLILLLMLPSSAAARDAAQALQRMIGFTIIDASTVKVTVSGLPKLRNRSVLRPCGVIHAVIHRESALSSYGISAREPLQPNTRCSTEIVQCILLKR
jgi:hypothetical protein